MGVGVGSPQRTGSTTQRNRNRLEQLPTYDSLRVQAERDRDRPDPLARPRPAEQDTFNRRLITNDRECMRCHPRRDQPLDFQSLRSLMPADYSRIPGQMRDRFDQAAQGLSPIDRGHLADRWADQLEGEAGRQTGEHATRITQIRTQLLTDEAGRLRTHAGTPNLPVAQRDLELAAADGLAARAAIPRDGSAAGIAPYRRLNELARNAALDNETRRNASEYAGRLQHQIQRRRGEELAGETPERALAGADETAQQINLSPEQRGHLVRETAEHMRTRGSADQANRLRGLDAERRVDDLARSERLSSTHRAVRSLDVAAELLNDGYGGGAAQLLDREARLARESAGRLDANHPDARVLGRFADNAEARATAYRAVAPRAAYEASAQLDRAGVAAREEAERLRGQGRTQDAAILDAISQDSRLQADLTRESARNTDSLMGRGILQTYQQIVNASFDRRIDETGTLFGLRTGPRDRLVQDRERMQTVFAELDRTMRDEGISLDRAWNRMFDDRAIDGWRDNPRRVPGFATRNDAAAFLRDHELTRGLLMPFADMARGFHEGNAGTIDRAQGDVVRSLREHGQWDIARQVLDDHLRNARTPEGRAEAGRLDASERGEWWRQKAGDFVQRDLPVLVLSGVLTGGAGWGVRALGTAAGWGQRAIRGAQLATELGAFVPTERLLNEAMTGRRADWSAGALARDYAFTLGGYGLFRAAGRGWQYFRDRGAGQALTHPPYAGPPIEGAVGGVNRTIQALDNAFPNIPANASRQSRRIIERTQQVRDELTMLRDAVQRSPTDAGRQALERLSREADDLTRAAQEYAALQRPALPRNTRATPEQLAAHERAMAQYVEREAALRAGLERRIGDYSQNLFRTGAEVAGVRVAPFNPEAGHFQNSPLTAIDRARAIPGVDRSANVGYAELRVGDAVHPVGPAVSGTGPGSLPRTGPTLVGETRVLPRQPGQHGFPRANDSEVQMLEAVAERMAANPNASGTLRLYTEFPPCPSCLRVMGRFRQMYPNLRVEVFYGSRSPHPWAGWLGGEAGQQMTDE